MFAAFAGNPDVPLTLGHPQYGAALGTFEKAVEILLTPFCFLTAVPPGQRGNTGKEPLIFRMPLGYIFTENTEITACQTDQSQKPKYAADTAVNRHSDDQKYAGKKAQGNGKRIRPISPGEKTTMSEHTLPPFR